MSEHLDHDKDFGKHQVVLCCCPKSCPQTDLQIISIFIMINLKTTGHQIYTKPLSRITNSLLIMQSCTTDRGVA